MRGLRLGDDQDANLEDSLFKLPIFADGVHVGRLLERRKRNLLAETAALFCGRAAQPADQCRGAMRLIVLVAE